MNIKLLERIQRKILAHPEHFDITEWYFDKNTKRKNLDCVYLNNGVKDMITPGVNNCKTTACIAGWALILDPLGFENNVSIEKKNSVSIEKNAGKVLGLTIGECYKLFHVDYWPEQFKVPDERYWTSDDEFIKYTTTPELAVERISHFILTNGEE